MMIERQRGPHVRLVRQFCEAAFGAVQKMFGYIHPGVFGRKDEMFHQIPPSGLTLGDRRH